MKSDLEIVMADLKKCAQDLPPPPPVAYYRWFLAYTNSLSGHDSQTSDLRKIMMPRMAQVVHYKKMCHIQISITLFNLSSLTRHLQFYFSKRTSYCTSNNVVVFNLRQNWGPISINSDKKSYCRVHSKTFTNKILPLHKGSISALSGRTAKLSKYLLMQNKKRQKHFLDKTSFWRAMLILIVNLPLPIIPINSYLISFTQYHTTPQH